MALVNHEKKEINAKIVFYGAGSSGKTTNIRFLYEKMKPEFRGQLKFLNTRSGKMLFFDFKRPDQISIGDYDVRFHIYTVQGEISDYAVWKTVLKGMDGLVFIADSEPYRMPDNLQYYEKFVEYLESLGKGFDDLPCLLQCNKQDIPGATTIEEMKELLHSIDCPIIPASAKNGEGVLGTLSNIVRLVLQKLRETPVDAGEKEKSPSDTEIPAPAAMTEDLHVPRDETALHAGENILSAPCTDTVPQHQFEHRFTIGDIEDTRPEQSTKTDEPDVTTDERDREGEEVHETPVGAVSAFNEEQIICEQPLELTSHAEFEPEAAPLSAEPAETLPNVETHRPDAAASEIDFAGEMEQIAPGHLRLPITVRYGQETKKIALDLKLSIETLPS